MHHHHHHYHHHQVHNSSNNNQKNHNGKLSKSHQLSINNLEKSDNKTTVISKGDVSSALNLATSGNASASLHPQQRRRKKRPNYGTRTVEVRRGFNGFGFTISGQQPCRLSCIVNDSPADQAGLRVGDFLISVNGLNVSKLSHETVVQLIGNSFGSIRMQIAENYYSDSSDEEDSTAMMMESSMSLLQQQQHLHQQYPHAVSRLRATKPRYLHHKARLQRMRNSPQKKRQMALVENRVNTAVAAKLSQPPPERGLRTLSTSNISNSQPTWPMSNLSSIPLHPLIEELPVVVRNMVNTAIQQPISSINNSAVNRVSETINGTTPSSSTVSANSSTRKSPTNTKSTSLISSSDVANVSAMVRVPTNALEYRTIVGYLGTIEMPKQISQSSKLQTVRSCIRKLRQEKRQPTTVLMIILPDSLCLQSSNGKVLATYASSRLNYVSSSSESENRFFGLVTSAIHTTSPLDEEQHTSYNYDDHTNDGSSVHNIHNSENNTNANNIILTNSTISHSTGINTNSSNTMSTTTINSSTSHITISNSCHVFVIDTKLCEHSMHLKRAEEFHIECTKDAISGLCLEFPNNSEYVVNLIRSMYTMRILPPAAAAGNTLTSGGVGSTNHSQMDYRMIAPNFDSHSYHSSVISGNLQGHVAVGEAAAHSPQPSNHSEVSTTTSNSDSGIGFHNDFNNISDRIVVVDFSQQQIRGQHHLINNQLSSIVSPRPTGIVQQDNIESNSNEKNDQMLKLPLTSSVVTNNVCMTDESVQKRLSVRAMETIQPTSFRMDNASGSRLSQLTASRSCDDVLNLIENDFRGVSLERNYQQQKPQKTQLQQQHLSTIYASSSMDDISSLHIASEINAICHTFHRFQPQSLPSPTLINNSGPEIIKNQISSSIPDKLSPQVYKTRNTLNTDLKSITVPHLNQEDLKETDRELETSIHNDDQKNNIYSEVLNISSRSLQELNVMEMINECQWRRNCEVIDNLEVTASENDLSVARKARIHENILGPPTGPPPSLTPRRRGKWLQTSFRTPRSDKKKMEEKSKIQRSFSLIDAFQSCTLESNHNSVLESMATAKKNLHLTFERDQNVKESLKNDENSAQFGNLSSIGDCNDNENKNNIAVINGDNNMNNKISKSVSKWSLSFEQLLQNSNGLRAFTDFLKSEYAAENIYFWCACEKYRLSVDKASSEEIREMAKIIYEKHLSSNAPEPVNVDALARSATEQKLQQTEGTFCDPDLFKMAQIQIFNLMKYDSYQRFLRSDLYKKCQRAELQGLPLPIINDEIESGNGIIGCNSGGDHKFLDKKYENQEIFNANFNKLQKSISNAEDRRRKSLLPWHRKTRRKSRDLSEEFKSTLSIATGTTLTANTTTSTTLNHKNGSQNSTASKVLRLPGRLYLTNFSSDLHGSRSSLSSASTYDQIISSVGTSLETNAQLCRVKFSDGSNTIAQVQSSETIGELIDRVLKKRGIQYNAYEVFNRGLTMKSMNLQMSCEHIAGKEIEVERRVTFKLDLPTPKVIAVKSKPNKQLLDVMKPILHKYHYNLNEVEILHRETQVLIELTQTVVFVDGQRLQVRMKSNQSQMLVTKKKNSQSNNRHYGAGAVQNSGNTNNETSLSALDEITNTVFNDLMRLKIKMESPAPIGNGNKNCGGDIRSLQSDDCGSETSSLFDRIRGKRKSFLNSTSSLKIPALIPSQSASVPAQLSYSSALEQKLVLSEKDKETQKNTKTQEKFVINNTINSSLPKRRIIENQDELLEGLKRAQLSRLEDQRGTEINIELPDFLKDNENHIENSQQITQQQQCLDNQKNGSNYNSEELKTVSTLQHPENVNISIEKPQPAPRLSITNTKTRYNGAMETFTVSSPSQRNNSTNGNIVKISNEETTIKSPPPPLPPKPKILPMKPSNWGVLPIISNNLVTSYSISSSGKAIGGNRNTSKEFLTQNQQVITKNMTAAPYLDEPSSSFV